MSVIYSKLVTKSLVGANILQIGKEYLGNLPAFLGVNAKCLQLDKDRTYPYPILVRYKDSLYYVKYKLDENASRLERLYIEEDLQNLIAEKYNWDKTNESFTPGRIDIVVNSQNELELQFFDEQGNNL